jgi:hypothetical protein
MKTKEEKAKHAKRMREYYKNNKSKFRESNRRWKAANKDKVRELERARLNRVMEELKGGGCVLCGYNKCIAALDLHHVDPSVKEKKISHMKNKKDRDREAAKCIVLCANCHREYHYKGTGI